MVGDAGNSVSSGEDIEHLAAPTLGKTPQPDPIPLGSAVVAILFLSLVGWLSRQRCICWNLHDEIFLRLAAALLLIGITYSGFRYVLAMSRVSKPNWWNLGGTPDNPSWDDVRRMTLGRGDDDPVVYPAKREPVKRAVRAVAGHVAVGALFIEAISFLVEGPILPRLLAPIPTNNAQLLNPKLGFHTVELAISSNLTAFLALIAAAISIYFTHRQLQAKVKADSRQAWLDKLRGEIARFIAFADTLHYRTEGQNLDSARRKLTASRLEMELMLNPSEKDHRLLMFLSIKLAFFDQFDDAGFNDVHDIVHLKAAIAQSPGYDQTAWQELLGPIPEAADNVLHEKKYGDLIGYLMRLSHVVLKREWQRVKETR